MEGLRCFGNEQPRQRPKNLRELWILASSVVKTSVNSDLAGGEPPSPPRGAEGLQV